MSGDFEGVGVIFDLDGTVIDTAADLAAAMNHALGVEGHKPLPVEAVRYLVGHGAKAMIAKGFALSGVDRLSDAAMEVHRERFLAYYRAHISDYSQPFDGALEAVEMLTAHGARVAICTNKPEAPARQLISELGLSAVFPIIVGGDTAGAAKPDPAPVTLCMRRLGARRFVFVGDSDTDIMAASNTAMPSLTHVNGYGPFTKADISFACFDDYRLLPSLIRQAIESGEGEA